MGVHVLTRDFAAAGQKHVSDMTYLSALVQKLEGRTFLESIPVFNPDDWHPYGSENCTAFAFNRATAGRLQPGYLGTGAMRFNEQRPQGLERYAKDIHRSLAKDGAIYVGENLPACVGKGVPAALFFRTGSSEDYHWYGLRRVSGFFSRANDQLVWSDKCGDDVTSGKGNNASIFSRARNRRYEVFGGYYALPKHLMGPS